MTFDDLTHPEKMALVGMARLMVRADNQFSREEAAILDELASEFGAEEFWQLAGEVAELEPPAIQAYARDVLRRDVQEFIYALLFELAAPGTIVDSEARLLDWVARTWKLDAAIDTDPYRS